MRWPPGANKDQRALCSPIQLFVIDVLYKVLSVVRTRTKGWYPLGCAGVKNLDSLHSDREKKNEQRSPRSYYRVNRISLSVSRQPTSHVPKSRTSQIPEDRLVRLGGMMRSGAGGGGGGRGRGCMYFDDCFYCTIVWNNIQYSLWPQGERNVYAPRGAISTCTPAIYIFLIGLRVSP